MPEEAVLRHRLVPRAHHILISDIAIFRLQVCSFFLKRRIRLIDLGPSYDRLRCDCQSVAPSICIRSYSVLFGHHGLDLIFVRRPYSKISFCCVRGVDQYPQSLYYRSIPAVTIPHCISHTSVISADKKAGHVDVTRLHVFVDMPHRCI